MSSPKSQDSDARARAERVIVYVDGFNLYFGLCDKGWRRYLWLNLHALARCLLKPCQALVRVKYFTSRVKNRRSKEERQNTYLEALETLPDLDIFYGKYLVNDQQCPKCGALWPVPTEKMTDVNIAVEMLVDAHQNAFDTALLVSADSDLTGPVTAIRRLFPAKRVVIAFPPKRSSFDLQNTASGYFTIGEANLRKSQLPRRVPRADGFILRKPSSWR